MGGVKSHFSQYKKKYFEKYLLQLGNLDMLNGNVDQRKEASSFAMETST